MIYGYIRISTDKQSVENQRFEIENFSKTRSYAIDKYIEEIVSETKKYSDRKLGILLKNLKKDDIVIVSELSRLGRNLMQIMSILNLCMQNQIRIISIKENYELCDNINSKVLAFAFGLSAEIERQLISQRTKSINLHIISRVCREGFCYKCHTNLNHNIYIYSFYFPFF